MTIILSKEITELCGESFYDLDFLTAFKNAKTFAGKNGVVASLPDLINGRILAPENNELWQNWYHANSEENVCKTMSGNKVVIIVHGGGIWTPEKIEKNRTDEQISPNKRFISDYESAQLLTGKFDSGIDIPVFSYSDFKKQNILPKQYAIVIDFNGVKKTYSGYQDAKKLECNHLFIARVGGIDRAHSYLKKARELYKTSQLGNWHLYNSVDTEQAQGGLLFLDNNRSNCYQDNFISGEGRFVGAVLKPATTKNNETVAPELEQILQNAKRFVPDAIWADFCKKISELYN